MVDETANNKSSWSTASAASASAGTSPLRKTSTLPTDEPTATLNRRRTNRWSTDGIPSGGNRRRSSNFSEYSLNELNKNLRDSTDDILFPKPSDFKEDDNDDSSHWDSVPLAFALLPAIGGLFFTNGSSVITDVMLLGFAAILLNWSVRVPWDWYHSAQSIRKKEEYNEELAREGESGDEGVSESTNEKREGISDEKPIPQSPSKTKRRSPIYETATSELYVHEILALLSCFVFPIAGAYILHSIRSQLSRPSEGLVSNYNLTIFLLASELRPMAHLVRLLRARTLHLQRVVNSNPYNGSDGKTSDDTRDLIRRLEELETRVVEPSMGSSPEPVLNGKQSAILTTEVRRTMQPDLDALNRAVRRYEKRATLQSFQTESRLLDLEARLNDAISLAAAAANNSQKRGTFGMVFDWISSAMTLPLQAFGTISSLPFRTLLAVVDFTKFLLRGQISIEKPKKSSNGRYAPHAKSSDRGQGRPKR